MIKTLNFILILLLNLNVMAQLIIKDEIVLDTPDEKFLSTPFYGNVYINFDAPVQKLRATFKVGLFQKFLNEITGQTYECTCG